MTIVQLKYAIAISNAQSMKEAARNLYVSQPGLSTAIRELEEEIGIELFRRTHRGITVTPDGEEFLGYARQVIEQYQLMEQKYSHKEDRKVKFSVSMQHYTFAVNAFMEMVREFGLENYEFSVHETQTYEVINDLKNFKSEVGIVAVNSFNKQILDKLFRESHLEFHELMQCNTYIYLWKGHPLADREELSLEELEDYPCLIFEQGKNNSFYFKEEALCTYDYKKVIQTNDRATSMEMMIGLNGYAVGSGVLCDSLNGDEYCAIKLKEEEVLTIGYLIRKGNKPSPIGEKYIEELKKYT